MSAEGDGAGDGAEDPDAPAAELTPEERLSLEMDAFEARWGKKKRVAEERRRRLLWKVKINEADVETVARECELDADAAWPWGSGSDRRWPCGSPRAPPL